MNVKTNNKSHHDRRAFPACRKYSCSVCGNSYHYQASLFTHMHTHANYRPHKCGKCAAAFLVKSHLNEHLKIHSDERPFMCEVCGKAFKFSSVLESHLTIHTREEKYSCSMCGKSYRYRASLHAHMRAHTGHRPHRCDKCGAAFLVKSHLIDHLRIHSGEKPFECEICSASFSRTVGLQKHLKAHIRRGLKMDLDSAMYRAKLRAKVRPRSSKEDKLETRSFHHSERDGTTGNQVLYTDFQPDDEACVVFTLYSIGDGSICSHSVKKQETNGLSSETFMKGRSLPAQEETGQNHEQEVINCIRNFSCSREAFVGNGDGKHPGSHDKPNSPLKCITTIPSNVCSPLDNISYIEAMGVETEASSDVTPQHVDIGMAQIQASVSSGRSMDILQPTESGSNSVEREESKPNTSMSETVRDGLGIIKETWGHSERSKEITGIFCGTGVPGKQTCAGLELCSGTHQYTCAQSCQVFQQKAPSSTHHCHLRTSTSFPERDTHAAGMQPDLDDPHVCNMCGKSFNKKMLLMVHCRKHNGEKLYLCQECNKGLISATNWRVHRHLHTSNRPFQCPSCKKPHRRGVDLQQHLRMSLSEAETARESIGDIPISVIICIESVNGMLVCNVQEQNYHSSLPLTKSSRQPLCQTLGPTSEVKLKKQDHPYECEAVYETVLEIEESDLSQVIFHTKSQVNSKDTSGKETDNPQESRLEESYGRLHVDKVIKTLQPRTNRLLRCNYCPKSFKYQNDVTSHERSQAAEKPYLCPECGKGFSKKKNMETHTRTHTGERPFLCDCCGKHFSHRYTLEAHKRLHTLEKPFQCGVCGKSFRHETSRHIHLKRHAGEKNFKCEFCPKAFVTKIDLQNHRRIHTKERPYRCDECGRRFAVRHHLTDHNRLHRGDRPHKCQFCNMSFVRARSWKLHVQKHTVMQEPFQGSV